MADGRRGEGALGMQRPVMLPSRNRGAVTTTTAQGWVSSAAPNWRL